MQQGASAAGHLAGEQPGGAFFITGQVLAGWKSWGTQNTPASSLAAVRQVHGAATAAAALPPATAAQPVVGSTQ